MGEAIREFLVYLPRYLREFGSVFSGPKQFMDQKNVNDDKSFNDSVLFLVLSLVLATVMTAPLLPPEKKILIHMGGQAGVFLMAVSLFAIALRFSWRIVGGKAPVRSFFVIYAYYFGVMVVLLIFIMLLAEGIFKVFDPDLHREVLEAQSNNDPLPDMSDKWVPRISWTILGVGYLCIGIWSLIGWGAYRKLNNLGKGRSFVALLIMGPFGWLIALAIFFVNAALE